MKIYIGGLLALILTVTGSRSDAQVAAVSPATSFLLTGTSAAGATGLVALGTVAAPIAGLAAVVIAGGYVIYMTHEQYRELLASGQIDRWQERGLNSDLAVTNLAPEKVAQCRVRHSTAMGGATIGFRTCILDAMPTSADESISAPLAQFSTVALPSVQERVQTGITGTAHCRPQDSNEDLYRKTAHNNQYECSNDVRNVLPRKLESTACATRASANEFLNDLARCQSQLDHLNYCLHLLEVRGLLGEFQRRQHGEYIPPAARWDFSSYTGPAWLERNITAMQAIIPHLESRCLDKLRRSQPSSPNAPRPRGAIQ